MDKAQKIGCDVEFCKFQDKNDCCCTLGEIKVSCTCDADEVKEKANTICDSFECKDCK